MIENSKMIPIELKYKTKKICVQYDGEEIQLKDHGAQDTGRYDFIKDIERLEKLKASDLYPIEKAYAVMLTNCPLYYKSTGKISVDEAFKIHQGNVVHGKLSWDDQASVGTKKSREAVLDIRGQYIMDWKLMNVLNVEFGYLNILI